MELGSPSNLVQLVLWGNELTRTSCTKLEGLPSFHRNLPVNRLAERYSSSRLARLPSSAGISPVNWFAERDSSSRLERAAQFGGISPVSSFPTGKYPPNWAVFITGTAVPLDQPVDREMPPELGNLTNLKDCTYGATS